MKTNNNDTEPGLLLAWVICTLAIAWGVATIVGDAIWRQRMNEVVRQRMEAGETFIYDSTREPAKAR